MSGEAFNIFDLLTEAKQAEEQVLTLPPEVRIKISPENIVRLKLLTISNVMALADAAAKNPKRWEALRLHYHIPQWTQKDIADWIDVKKATVKAWLSSPLCDPEEYWGSLPPVPEKTPRTYRRWEEVPNHTDKEDGFGTASDNDDAAEEENTNQKEKAVQYDE